MQPTIVVSGSPRSGTTLMMRILHRGGFEFIADTDATHTLDENHPYGTYEIVRPAKVLISTPPEQTAGKVIKVIAPNIRIDRWPLDRPIKVVFMTRDPNEIISSMITANTVWSEDPVTMVMKARAVLQQLDADVHYVAYKDLVQYPKTTITLIAEFLGMDMDITNAMTAVDPDARNRLRKDKKVVTFAPPMYKVLKQDNDGGTIGARVYADDISDEEMERIKEHEEQQHKTREEMKDAPPV